MELRPESNVISLLQTPPLGLLTDTDIVPSSQLMMGPIEMQMREKLSQLKGTSYQDTFDWSIYDQIAKRFGENQPRGSVVFNTTFKLVNYHTSCSKCHYAFEIDSYGRGCIHNCAFCYAKDQLTTRGFWNKPIPFPVNLAEIRKIMYTVFETDKPSKWREVMGKRTPVRIGSMSDSFMLMDERYGVTKELLNILNHYEYPHIIFTRSDLVAKDEYLKLLKPWLVSVQMSMSGNNDYYTRKVEPGAPTYRRRLIALKKLAEAGLWTTVRLNPFFPTHPDGYFTDEESIIKRFGSRDAVPTFDWFNWDMLAELKEAHVPSVLAGVVRLSSKAINNMTAATGVNIRDFFKPENLVGSGDRRFSDAEISYYYNQLKAETAKLGMRFNTCYIGNGEKDYYQYQNLWSNKGDCCDAIGNVDAFKLTSQNISWDQRVKHAAAKDIAKKSQLQEIEIAQKFATPDNTVSL